MKYLSIIFSLPPENRFLREQHLRHNVALVLDRACMIVSMKAEMGLDV